MRIIKFKLVKGTYPFVTFSDGAVEVTKNYPSTEAPPKMDKCMRAFNSHITEVCEQYAADGQHDYDNVAARSYSIKGDGEKQSIVLTGIRTLQGGGTITLNTPSLSLDTIESNYGKVGQLLVCLENMETEITKFMKSNPSEADIQGKLAFTKPDDVVVESDDAKALRMSAAALNGEETDVTDLYKIPEPKGEEMPKELSLAELKAQAKVRTLTSKEQERLQELTAQKNSKKTK